MRDIEVFLPKVSMNATGVSIPAAFDAIRDAVDEFCRKTRLWRYEDEFDVTATTATALAPPYGAQVLDIERIDFNGNKLDPASTQWLDEQIPCWRDDTVSVCANYYTQTEPNTIRLVPIAEGSVKVWLTLTVGQDADQVPDFIADQHRETIAKGALGRLLMVKGKPYTDLNLAALKTQEFKDAIDTLKSQVIRGQQRARVGSKASFL